MTQLLDRPGVWLQDVYAIRLFLRCPSLMSQALRGPGGTYSLYMLIFLLQIWSSATCVICLFHFNFLVGKMR